MTSLANHIPMHYNCPIIHMISVKDDPHSLEVVPHDLHTLELHMAAVKISPLALMYIPLRLRVSKLLSFADKHNYHDWIDVYDMGYYH